MKFGLIGSIEIQDNNKGTGEFGGIKYHICTTIIKSIIHHGLKSCHFKEWH